MTRCVADDRTVLVLLEGQKLAGSLSLAHFISYAPSQHYFDVASGLIFPVLDVEDLFVAIA